MSRKTSKSKATKSTKPAAKKAAPAKQPAPKATKGKRAAPTASTHREGTKQAKLIAMLQGPNGASIAEIAKALDWEDHTVRGAIAGALKKKLGLTVTAEKVDQRGTVYRIPA